MSSREIAELTGKRHDNVLRDIKILIEQGAIDRLSFEEISYKDSYGREQAAYELDFDATMTLVTGYNAVLRARVIRRWRELETGRIAEPISSSFPLPSEIAARELKASHEMLKTSHEIALFFGLKGNQALLCADKAVRKQSGVSPRELLEIDLKTPNNEALLIATEIGRQFEPALSANAVNRILIELGLMKRKETCKDKYVYRLTDRGKEFGEYVDVGKSHSDGTPVQQIKWRESVVPVIAGIDNQRTRR